MKWISFFSDILTQNKYSLDLSITDKEIIDSQLDRDAINRIVFS